ncbi:MAG: hypothetical protein M1286_00315 [Candidatus Marsarchaeota archaeon]|nr:hypothetical protein [Candidatus Marsarchaeota archaeon]
MVTNALKTKLLLLCALAAVALIGTIAYTRLEFLLIADTGIVLFNINGLYNSLFIWQSFASSGSLNVVLPLLYALLYAALIPMNAFGITIPYTTFVFVLLFAGSAGMFLFVFELTKKSGTRIAAFCGVTSALIFTLQFDAYVRTNDLQGMLLPFSFLFLYYFLRDINKTERKIFWFSAFILSFSIVIAIGTLSYIFQSFLFLVIVFSVMLLTANPTQRCSYIKYFSIATFAIVLINATMIFSIILAYLHLVANGYFVSSSLSDIPSSSLLQVLLGFAPVGSYAFFGSATLIGNAAVGLVSALLIFAIAMLSIFSLRSTQGTQSLSNRIVIAFLTTYLLFIGIANTTNGPFGTLWSLLATHLPYLVVFRVPYVSTHYVFLFLISVLFGIGSAKVIETGRYMKYGAIGLSLLILMVVALVIYQFGVLPAAGAFRVQIPNYVLNISAYVNKNVSGFAAATLPVDAPYQFTTWYSGPNVYSAFIAAPFYTGGFVYYGIPFLMPVSALTFGNLGYQLANSELNGTAISNLLDAFGIKYIIVQGDATVYSDVIKTYGPAFNLSTIAYNLNSYGLSPVKRENGTTVYLNANAMPLVYVTNIENFAKSGSTLLNKTADMRNYSVYTGDILGSGHSLIYGTVFPELYNSAGRINPQTINSMSYPSISFIENDPTSITVHVQNATTPFYLVFRETYDNYWTAAYPNGTAVPSRDHIAVNGFANAWYINQEGNYTILLSYTLQQYVWLLWAISIASFGAVVYVGYIGWRGRHGG